MVTDDAQGDPVLERVATNPPRFRLRFVAILFALWTSAGLATAGAIGVVFTVPQHRWDSTEPLLVFAWFFGAVVIAGGVTQYAYRSRNDIRRRPWFSRRFLYRRCVNPGCWSENAAYAAYCSNCGSSLDEAG